MNTILSLNNVSYAYPSSKDRAVSNISLDIKQGKIYSIAGINGSGKTTLGLIMRGFIPKIYNGTISGDVQYCGEPMANQTMDKLCQEIGYVFQNPFTQITAAKDTVFEEIAFALENLGVDPEDIHNRTLGTIRLLDIEDIKDKNPMELSGGQKQKVAIASVIVMNPNVLILDEPTSQLDPVATKEIFEIIKLLKQRGTTVILIEHKLEIIAEYTDELIILEDGKLVSCGDTQSVLENEAYNKCSLEYPKYFELYRELADMSTDTFYTLAGTLESLGGQHE